MFINCSNHFLENWSEEQLDAVKQFGVSVIKDYPFPNVPADANESQIQELAEKTIAEILKSKPTVVMCQGEFTITHLIVNTLLENGIKVVAACSERKTTETVMEDGSVKKESCYRFVRFREYRK